MTENPVDQYQARLAKAESILAENEIELAIRRDSRIVNSWVLAHPWQVRLERFKERCSRVRGLFRTKRGKAERHAKIKAAYDSAMGAFEDHEPNEKEALDILHEVIASVSGVTAAEIMAALTREGARHD